MTRRVGAIALSFLALCLVTAPPAALAADPGLTVLSFLKLGAGARAASMGDAYVAVTQDASATYWNPAGLLGIQRNDVIGVHNAWIQDLRHEFAAVGVHRGRHAIGLSFIGLYTPDLEQRDAEGNFTGHFGFSDNAFAASYAFQATDRVGVGATARYLRESIVGTSDGDFALDGLAFDVGGTWATPLTGVSAGAALRNLGGQLSYNFSNAASFDLPTTLQAGLAYHRADVRGGLLTVSGDVLAVSGDDTSVRVGAEYAYRGQFMVGAGYKTGLENENVSFGVGYENGIRVHYAFTPLYADLGNSHRVSLGYAW
jgi:hypothetical protein